MNFIQQGYKGNNSLFYYLVVIIVVFFGWQIIGIIPLLLVAFQYCSNIYELTKAASNNFIGIGINNNLFLFLMILMFAFGLFFLYLAVKFIHKRPFTSLFTSRDKIDWSRFWTGFIAWGLIATIITILTVFLSYDSLIWNFKPFSFFTLLVISFLFLPIQTSFEELLFRGYLMQGIGLGTLNKKFPFICILTLSSLIMLFFLIKIELPFYIIFLFFIFYFFIVLFFIISKKTTTFFDKKLYKLLYCCLNRFSTPLIFTSVTFGLLHGANPEVEKLGYISMIFYIGTGLFYGIITLMDEGIELSLGLHAINNIIAAFIITTDWTVFKTDALFIDISEPSVGFEMFFPVFILYPLMIYFFSKKYNWFNWKKKLFGRIEKPKL